jgi:hypothetical protein
MLTAILASPEQRCVPFLVTMSCEMTEDEMSTLSRQSTLAPCSIKQEAISKLSF